MALRLWSRVLSWRAAQHPELLLSARPLAVRSEVNLAWNWRGTTGCTCTPARCISSNTLLSRLTKGKAAAALAEADGSFNGFPPSVPSDSSEQLSLLVKHPDQPEQAKVLKVAIIGAPNAGKSTLSNQLLGRKVFAVSEKVHTTRTRSLGVLTEDDTQIILLDTPGLTTSAKAKRHQLEKSLLVDPWNTVTEADLIVVMADMSDRWMRSSLDFEVLKCLAKHPDIPAILILNKVDRVRSKVQLLEVTNKLTCGIVNGKKLQIRHAIKRSKKAQVAPDPEPVEDGAVDTPATSEGLQRSQSGWPHFRDVFMLSSLDQEDVETLKRYLMLEAKPGNWEYHSEVLTDQSPQEVCANIIREKLLNYLPQEVPYAITQSVELWQERESGELDVSVKLYAKKESHVSMVIGTAGQMVARISQEVGEDLTSIFLQEVKVKLSVKLRK